MFLIKRLYTLLYMLLTASTLLAQRQPIFDASGKLTSLKGSGNTLATFDVNTLKEEDRRTKKAARQQLIKKIDATIRILSTPTYKPPLIRLYSQLWDTAETIKYLGAIRKALNNQDTAGLTGSLASDLLEPLKHNLLDGSENIFSAKLDTPQKTKISLSKKDPFNAFVIDYYNKTIATFPADLTLDKKIAETYELLRTIDSIGRLTRQASNQDMFDEMLFKTMKSYDDLLHTPQSILLTVKGRFKAPWFRQWFWFRGGEVTLNPLDFTTAEFLANNPMFDASKAAL